MRATAVDERPDAFDDPNGWMARCRHVRPVAATRVLAGSVPDPLLSSRSRGWNGITLELHGFQSLDTVVQPADHVIAVHLAGAVNLRMTRDGRTRARDMEAGDVTITPVGAPVRWQQTSASLVVLLRLAPAYLRGVAQAQGVPGAGECELREAFATRDANVEALGRRLLGALELEGADSALYADMLACELATHLLRQHGSARTSSESPKARLSPHKLKRTIEFIDDNLANPLTLAAMASAVALSPGHFAHAFRQATGVAPHRYVVERRVERAKMLLRQSDLPITEIADRVGCSSNSHFSVLFQRVTGLTPRQFRARICA